MSERKNNSTRASVQTSDSLQVSTEKKRRKRTVSVRRFRVNPDGSKTLVSVEKKNSARLSHLSDISSNLNLSTANTSLAANDTSHRSLNVSFNSDPSKPLSNRNSEPI